MIDFGIDKLAIIGAVALIVIGPEKLPRVARTVGVLVGKAQRYVAQVQSEVNRSMELEELKKMKSGIEEAARDINQQVNDGLHEVSQGLYDAGTSSAAFSYNGDDGYRSHAAPVRKNWRVKRLATPLWYKQRQGIRRHAQSGAARVARFRPHNPNRN
ncbi:MAG TPA: twin-arginine translocase TatA/TatE family subunit [Aquabacterium sp.]|nr:twin-arginine translocase TatA/TatE family subunit [Aquabacterium sp.]